MIAEASAEIKTISPLKKMKSAIQYAYSESGTHARLVSRTLAHGNGKNEIRPRHRERRQEEKNDCGMKHSGYKKVPTAKL